MISELMKALIVTIFCKFEQLVVLNLQWNAISYWSQINFLKSLKSLRVLLLDGNQIRGVFYAGGFENLEVLSLNDCLLESNKISDLSNFISLKDFSVARNPFLYEVADQYVARSILIAENRNIVKLNNSEILRAQRKEAELFYINFLAKQFYADEENFMTNQKTFARLVGQYGKPANPLRISPMLSTIEVCFTYNNKDDVRNVPRGMEISKLKFFVKRIFGVPPRIQKLKLFDPEDGRNFDLEDDQNLDSFSLGNKATIIVECD
ncbi:uncharacterized protein LOC135122421 [Zophobas morio]|uniref:uncharacterized protein LOC135122421 n=1 Tax=Zophobas morio TaxID=2755281 RepID=UPI003082CC4B